MNHLFDVDAMLTRGEPTIDAETPWIAWCPDLDVVTQGDNSEHAIGMLMDAVRLTCESDLNMFEWGRDTDERVRHPLRRGASATLADDWPAVVVYRRIGAAVMEAIAVTDLPDDARMRGFVRGSVSVESRGGVVHCVVIFNDFTFVMTPDVRTEEP